MLLCIDYSTYFKYFFKGVKVVIMPNKVTQNLEDFVDALEACQVTRLFAVTSLVKNILSFVEMEAKRHGDKKLLRLSQVKKSQLRVKHKKILLFFHAYYLEP